MHLDAADGASAAGAPAPAPGEARRVAASAYVSGASLILLNTLPLLIGAIAERFHAGAVQLGYVASAINLSTTLINVSAPAWVRRVSWTRATLGAAILSIGAVAWAAVAASFTAVLALFLVLGGALSLLGVPAFASLGDSTRPGRSYSIAMFVQMALASVWAVAVPALVAPRWGYAGVILSLAVVVVPCLWLAGRLGTSSIVAVATRAAPSSVRPTPALLCGFVAFGVYIVGVTVFWYFVERLGTHLGLSKEWIGLTVACASFSPVAGAAAGAQLSNRTSPLTVAVAGNAVMIASYLAIGAGNAWLYLLSATAWGFGWAMSHPMFQALIRRADTSNRLFTLAPAVMGGSGMVAGGLGGHVIDRFGHPAALALSAVLAVAACALAYAVVRMTPRASAAD